MASSLEDVVGQMRQVGIELPARVDLAKAFDVVLRFATDKPKKDGWCRLHEYRSATTGKVYITGVFGRRGDRWTVEATSRDWTPAERAEWQVQRKAASRAADAERAKDAEAARVKAERMWSKGREFGPHSPPHPYLMRKRVDAIGVRQGFNGRLLVPGCNPQGALQGLQYIAPDGAKLFGTGTAKEGMSHLLGSTTGCHVLAFGEGYATCASAHMATGWPVVVCFDAGNLAPVITTWRKLYPELPFVVLADDDRQLVQRLVDRLAGLGITCTAAELRDSNLCNRWVIPGGPTVELAAGWKRDPAGVMRIQGTLTVDAAVQPIMIENAGQAKAHAAARRVKARVLTPFFADRDSQATDWNDLHLLAGLSSVREQLLAGIGAPPEKAERSGAQVDRPAADGLQPASVGSETAIADRTDSRAGHWGAFTVDDGGTWFAERDADGELKRPQFVCSPLRVVAITSDADGVGYGYLLELVDPRGKTQRWAMPARMLAGDGTEMRATLLGLGLRIGPGAKARERLMQYLQTSRPGAMAQCTERIGWHGVSFVLPRETLQPEPADGDEPVERIVFQTDGGPTENPFRRRGTLDGWRDGVAALCVGNSRLVFAVSSAFAAPLLRPARLPSGGFNVAGPSSTGKTTVTLVAASVMGGPDYMQRWRATDNAVESIAAQRCDLLLILDELAQVDPKTAGDISYMLANESGKARSSRTGATRPRATWRLLFLSTGEIGLTAHMADGGKQSRAGQEIRMVDIPAEVAPGTIFETTHGMEGGAAFAMQLAKASASQYGHAGAAWLAWLVDHHHELQELTRERIERLVYDWVPEAASGQVQRVGHRFALVAAAGEMATAAGVTGWPEGEATRGVQRCFTAWLESRAGGIGNSEDAQMLRQVRRFFEQDGEARFADLARANDDHAPRTVQRAGFRKTDGGTQVFYVFVETFRAEVCVGFDYKAVLRVLREAEHLLPGSPNRFDFRVRLPGLGLVNVYRIGASIFDDTAT